MRSYKREAVSGDPINTPSGPGVLIYHGFNGDCLIRLDSGESITVPFQSIGRR